MQTFHVVIRNGDGAVSDEYDVDADKFEVREEFTDDGSIGDVPTVGRHVVEQSGVRFYADGVGLVGYVDPDLWCTVTWVPPVS